jgi:hypothetical protein
LLRIFPCTALLGQIGVKVDRKGRLSLFAPKWSALAFWCGTLTVSAGVLLHVPMFWKGRVSAACRQTRRFTVSFQARSQHNFLKTAYGSLSAGNRLHAARPARPQQDQQQMSRYTRQGRFLAAFHPPKDRSDISGLAFGPIYPRERLLNLCEAVVSESEFVDHLERNLVLKA